MDWPWLGCTLTFPNPGVAGTCISQKLEASILPAGLIDWSHHYGFRFVLRSSTPRRHGPQTACSLGQAPCVAHSNDYKGSCLQADNCTVQMRNLEVLATAPCSFPYDGITCIDLHTPNFCHMRKCLRKDSVGSAERNSYGFGLSLHLSLTLSLVKTRARDDSKAIALSQGMPNRVH